MVLKWALRLLLAAVFIFAAYSKLKQSYLIFAMSIDAYGLLPDWAVLTVARVLPWLEVAIGAGLLIGWRLRVFAATGMGLLLFFFGILVYSYGRGLTIDCGCFGVGESLSPATLARDGALVLCAISLWLLTTPRSNGKVFQ